MSAGVHHEEHVTAQEDGEAYRSQLWKETERDRDHQAQNKRNTYVTERSGQQRVLLEKSCSAKKSLFGEVWRRVQVNRTKCKVDWPLYEQHQEIRNSSGCTKQRRPWQCSFPHGLNKKKLLQVFHGQDFHFSPLFWCRFYLFSCCFREADGISVGVKHLDPRFWLLASDD